MNETILHLARDCRIRSSGPPPRGSDAIVLAKGKVNHSASGELQNLRKFPTDLFDSFEESGTLVGRQ